MGSAVSLVGDENFGFRMYFKDLISVPMSVTGRKEECHNFRVSNWRNEAAVLC